MSLAPIEVTIESGKITPVQPHLLPEHIVGPNQITDHYLAALARQHGLILAAFDVALSRAFPMEPGLMELVR